MIIELNTRNLYSVETYFCRTDAFKYSFFPYSISEWNKLGQDLRNAKSYSTFKKLLLKIGRPSPIHIYKIHDPLGLKLLTRFGLSLSHLNEHRFNHNFDSCINPLCSCSLEVESTKHFFLHFHHYTNIHKTLLNTIEMIDKSILNVNDDDLIGIWLFGNCKFSLERNSCIIKASIILKTLRDLINHFFLNRNLFFFHGKFCCCSSLGISILLPQYFIFFPF